MTAAPQRGSTDAAYLVLIGISVSHFLNDLMQSVVTAIYPLLQVEFALDFWQIGMLSFAFQVTASLFQPGIGLYTDRNPMPQSLTIGMGATLLGLLGLALAPGYAVLFVSAMLIGLGSAVFHPEASRVARMASGGRFGTAQSVFQVGGNLGTAVGPLLAAFVVVPFGRPNMIWLSLGALAAMAILWQVGLWYGRYRKANPRPLRPVRAVDLTRQTVVVALTVLAVLVFTKNIYLASLSNYYTFFVIERFGLDAQQSQLMLFVFLAATVAGVMLGGPIGDRFGAMTVIWFSILGALPFTLLLPHADLFWTGALTVAIGIIMASAFPAILVFAQELMPGRVGMINGVFFGMAFGMGGIAAAALGVVADARGLDYVFRLCGWLPLLGILTIFLPRGIAAGR